MYFYLYGIVGWIIDDDFFLVYDWYDVWLVDFSGSLVFNNLIKGWVFKIQYCYIKFDFEEWFIEEVKLMLFYIFSEIEKFFGYIWFNIYMGVKDFVQFGVYSYDW